MEQRFFADDRLNKLSVSNEAADCAVRAIAVCCDISYEEAHKLATKHGRKPGTGTDWSIIVKTINELGYALIWVNTPCRTIRVLERDLPKTGSFLISVRGHVLGYHNGQSVDWAAGRCHRIRTVWRILRFRNLTKHDKQYLGARQRSPSGKYNLYSGPKVGVDNNEW
jgi:hypothetical protein